MWECVWGVGVHSECGCECGCVGESVGDNVGGSAELDMCCVLCEAERM